MAAPVLIGLTGAIASGKSAALEAFARAGAETISSDTVVHELLGTGEVRSLLVERWGEMVIAEDGAVERSIIAEIVFRDPGELRWLESELHPRVARRLADWRVELPDDSIGVVETPLLFEAGIEGAFDATVAVTAPPAMRERRAADRGHAGVSEREERQLTDEEKAARATYVIANDGTLEDLESKASELLETIRREGVVA